MKPDPSLPQSKRLSWGKESYPDAIRVSLYPEAASRVEAALIIAERLAQEWDLSIEGALPGATGCVVLSAGESVLRIPLQDSERATGTAMLHAFSPHGGIAILREDSASGAVLLPRLRPGSTLDTLREDDAIEAWISLVRRMSSATGDAPPVSHEISALWTLPTRLRLAHDALDVARRLLETSPEVCLLHGDLHHFNVLRSGDGWVAIDPEGVTGDPAYECAAFLRNPVPALGRTPELPALLRKRIHRLAEGLDYAAPRIWGWAFVRTARCVWNDPTPFEGAWLRVLHALDVLGPEYEHALC